MKQKIMAMFIQINLSLQLEVSETSGTSLEPPYMENINMVLYV